MALGRAELIIHPVRLRILQALTSGPKTTAQIAEELKDVPLSSLYRHLRLLLEGAMIDLHETRIVHGIQEKRYQLAQAPRVRQEDLDGLSAEKHLQYFTTYIVTLLQGFGQYLEAALKVDYAADRTGYTEVEIQTTNEEIDAVFKKLNAAIVPMLQNKPAPKRKLRKLAIITFPIETEGEENG
jgi:DNA-binding transcriptional ArsR family regulator